MHGQAHISTIQVLELLWLTHSTKWGLIALKVALRAFGITEDQSQNFGYEVPDDSLTKSTFGNVLGEYSASFLSVEVIWFWMLSVYRELLVSVENA